jgi:glycosyltransferase involved in cell wall biosynthesis
VFIAAHNGARIWGGSERALCLILVGLQDRGHRTVLFCNDPMVARRAGELGVPTEMARLGGDIAIHDSLRFAATLRRARPDVLIVGTFKKLWLCALAARLSGVALIARIGLDTDTPRNLKYRWVIRHWVNAVVLRAGDARGKYLAALPELPAHRIVVIHGAVEPRVASGPPGVVRRELGLGDDVRVVGSVGRLATQKRFDRLIEAVSRLPANVHGVVAGEGEERAALEAMAETAGVSHRFHFLGERQDVGDVLAALDVFVICSDKEGLSSAMLEALAAGVPVVSTPVSGAAEALEPGEAGRAPGEIVGFTVDELTTALRRLLSDTGLTRSMGQAALDRACERFDFAMMLDGWERVLSEYARGGPERLELP